VAQLKTILGSCDSAEVFAEKIVQALKGLTEKDPDYFKLFLEGLTAAQHSETVRRELRTAKYGLL